MIQANDVVLFQGDSITDCGRTREVETANDLAGLGRGYAMQAAATLLRDRPGDRLRFHNRGISGNRVVDLYARWKIDALNLRPDVISILIGVNDTWHHFTRDNGVEVVRYAEVFRTLLDWTLERLPEVRLILCEPFVLGCGVVGEAWVTEMAQRRAVVRQLAGEFGAAFVPFQAAFDEAVSRAEPAYWAEDGVHPTAAGHALMAQTWLTTVLGTAPVAG